MSYPKPSLTGDAVVLAGEGEATRLLVIERRNSPYQGDLAFPGGFAEPYETPLHTVLRELKEETGLELPQTGAVPLSLRTRKGRDPRGWTISQPFLFHLPKPAPVQAADDAQSAEWVLLTDLKKLAFDHGAVLCEALGAFWEGMPGFHPLLKGLRPYCGNTVANRDITFYGGSFNPWHEGHSACIELCPQPVVVVPDMNPFKQGRESICYWEQFRHILSRVEGVAGVFPGFFGRETTNPTVSWLPATSCSRKSLLMGDDNLAGLPDWIQAATLVKALDVLYVAPRKAPEQKLATAKAWLQENNPQCELVLLGDHPHRHLSSTAIRASRPS